MAKRYRNKNPLFVAYAKAADRVRCGDGSAEALAAHELAEAAYRASVIVPVSSQSGTGWWNLPVAKAMWEGDARVRSLS